MFDSFNENDFSEFVWFAQASFLYFLVALNHFGTQQFELFSHTKFISVIFFLAISLHWLFFTTLIFKVIQMRRKKNLFFFLFVKFFHCSLCKFSFKKKATHKKICKKKYQMFWENTVYLWFIWLKLSPVNVYQHLFSYSFLPLFAIYTDSLRNIFCFSVFFSDGYNKRSENEKRSWTIFCWIRYTYGLRYTLSTVWEWNCFHTETRNFVIIRMKCMNMWNRTSFFWLWYLILFLRFSRKKNNKK